MSKKLITVMLAMTLMFTTVEPMCAISAIVTEEELTDAYIEFSKRMADRDAFVSVCLENFISGYTVELTIEEYIEEMIDYENEILLKRGDVVRENDVSENNVVPRSTSGQWYDNIGTTTIKLAEAPSYSKYNIENVVHIGDVVYETDGGSAALVGHIALVVGTYYDADHYMLYIRTIEANGDGVVYGALDDARYDKRGIGIYKVANSTSLQRAEAVDFCIAQLGESYSIKAVGKCGYSDSVNVWYCSELVWAAYYNQDINFNGSGVPSNPFTPASLASSSELTKKTISLD